MKTAVLPIVLALASCVPVTRLDETERQLEKCRKELELSSHHLIEAPRAAAVMETFATAIVVVTADRVVINGEKIPGPDVSGRLRAILEEDPDTRLLVNAEPDVPYGEVIVLLDQARMAGFSEYRLAAGPPQRPLLADEP